jgi:PTS system mannose-specific IID component
MDKKLQFKMFMRSLFIQTGWNFTGMQNIGFAFTFLPALKKLYKGSELKKALSRHMEYFNTNPYLAGFTLGLCVKLEEKASQAEGPEKISIHNKIKTLKNSMSTATAAIGDRLFWCMLKPFTLIMTLFVMLSLGLNLIHFPHEHSKNTLVIVIGISVGFLFYNAVTLYIRWKSIAHGYRCAENKYCGLDFTDWNKIIKKLRFFGLVLVLFTLVIFLAEYLSFYVSL